MTATRPQFLRWEVMLALVVLALGYFAWQDQRAAPVQEGAVVLLVPDGMSASAPQARMWRDAASEEGVQLQVLAVSEWARAVTRHHRQWPALIVPDTFQRSLDDTAVRRLHEQVRAGTRLMLVYDAGLLDGQGHYAPGASRFSDLTGMQYGLYDTLRAAMTTSSQIRGSAAMMEHLQIPPGRYLDLHADFQHDSVMFSGRPMSREVAVNGYRQGDEGQTFPVLVTRGQPTQVLLHSEQGYPILSRQVLGKGETLFVNLPIGYLKQRTDGIFLSGMLRYFVQDMLGWPRLANTPDGKGGIVLNWHVDSTPAIPALQTLQKAGVLDEGPYSYHFTAGPDVYHPGDGAGMNVPANPEVRALIQDLARRGNAIGDHGGWIHNYFGERINDSNGPEYVQYLDLNQQALTAVLGYAPREYSAPVGNTPRWTLRWLEQHHFLGLYLTGDIGMGTTRTWLGQERLSPTLWMFPVLTMGELATAEDVHQEGVPLALYSDWLGAVVRFVRENQAVRLVYFHPPGAVMVLPAVRTFVQEMRACRLAGDCRWFTLTQMADFMNRREAVQWTHTLAAEGDVLSASAPQTLAQMSWWVPQARFGRPEVLSGQARIDAHGNQWRITVVSGKDIRVRLPHAR